jgi:hypothetical protein
MQILCKVVHASAVVAEHDEADLPPSRVEIDS